MSAESNIQQTRKDGMSTGNNQERLVYEAVKGAGYDAERGVRVPTVVDGIEKEADVIVGEKQSPRVIIESKYIRRSKHAREKIYQLVAASKMWKDEHDVRVIAILSGNFTQNSLDIADWGVDNYIHHSDPPAPDWFDSGLVSLLDRKL